MPNGQRTHQTTPPPPGSTAPRAGLRAPVPCGPTEPTCIRPGLTAKLCARHKKGSLSSNASELYQIPATAGKKEKERARLRLRRPGVPNRNHTPALDPASRPPRDWTGNSTAAPSPAPGPRPFRGVPPVGGASLTTPPLCSLLPERGRGRPATPKPQLPGRVGLRFPERPDEQPPSPQAPARPLYRPGPLPRQRGLHGPLLLIFSRRHRPSAAETGTSSAPAAASTKARRRRLQRSARREMEYSKESHRLHSRRAPRVVGWGLGRYFCLRGRGERISYSPASYGRARFSAEVHRLAGACGLAAG